jgi:DNA-directed RNA polymerase specialized sigma24 family protein
LVYSNKKLNTQASLEYLIMMDASTTISVLDFQMSPTQWLDEAQRNPDDASVVACAVDAFEDVVGRACMATLRKSTLAGGHWRDMLDDVHSLVRIQLMKLIQNQKARTHDSWEPYVAMISINSTRDVVKARYKDAHVVAGDALEAVADQSETGSDPTAPAQVQDSIDRVMMYLTQHFQPQVVEAVCLYFFQEMNQRQIAKKLNRSLGWVNGSIGGALNAAGQYLLARDIADQSA